MINDQWPSVDPGSFRHQIFLLQKATTVGIGGSAVAYTVPDVPTSIWASVDYIRGDEVIKYGGDVSQSYIKVTSWYRAEFTGGQRIQFGDSSWIVQNRENCKQMGIYMVLHCLAIGANT